MIFRFIAIISLLSIAGCEFPGEPEREYNKGVSSPQKEYISFGDFDNSQHVAGIVKFQIDTNSNFQSSRNYFYSIDNLSFTPIQNPDYTFQIYTQYYPDGNHIIYCGYNDGTVNLGLLNLISFPPKYDSLILFFDQKPPTPTSLTVSNYPGLKMNLSWSKNNDPNFYAYIIRRDGDIKYLENKDIDTIKDRNIISYDDFTIPMTCNLDIIYNVAITNRAQIIESNYVTIKTNNMVSDFYGNLELPQPQSVSDEIISLYSSLEAFSVITNSKTKSLYLAYSRACTLNKEKDKIFVATNTGISVINANSFVVERNFPRQIYMMQNQIMFTDARNRIYYVEDYGSSKLIVLDGIDGSYITQYDMSFQLIWATSNSRTYFYTFDTYGTLSEYDLSTDSLVLTQAKSHNLLVDDIKISSDDKFLFLKTGYSNNGPKIYNKITIIDITNLEIIDEIVIPNPSDGLLESFCLTDQYLYFSCVDDYTFSTNPRIFEYELSMKEFTRNWHTKSLARSMITSLDAKTLYFTEIGIILNQDNTTSYIKLK